MTDTTLRDQLAKLIVNRDEFDGADAIIAAGWRPRPPAHTVTTDGEARALPVGTVICDAEEYVARRLWDDDDGRDWVILGVSGCFTEYAFVYPLTVLYEPEEGE